MANIRLKVRAHRELFERKQNGDASVDEKDVQKHLKDILRIAVTLTGDEQVILSPAPAQDIQNAISKLEVLPEKQFKQVMEKAPGARQGEIMRTLKQIFQL